MMRILYLVSHVVTIALISVSFYYIIQVSDARSDFYMQSYSSYDTYDPYGSANYYDTGGTDEGVTQEAGFVMIAFMVFYLALQVLALIKIKSIAMKIMGIIGLVLTGIMLAWDAIMIGSPGSISFDEVGAVFILFGVIMLGFGVPGTIIAFKKKV
jgi:hypothetical protein